MQLQDIVDIKTYFGLLLCELVISILVVDVDLGEAVLFNGTDGAHGIFLYLGAVGFFEYPAD
jgi:hypothetical protein